ncbi:DUF4232 domain-containing protein [Lentzea sp. E54]|uniref:DUF4232 domain-containing protein n=1 Tax=Lentzea xerophila TaxID=3435883 RepID=UPI003DA1E9C6
MSDEIERAPEDYFSTLQLEFRNTGAAECTLFGYPGVSFGGEDGRTFDPPRSGAAHNAVRLAPGATAHSSLRVHTGDQATGWHVKTISVTPPNTTSTKQFVWKANALMQYGYTISGETVIGPVTAK